jgi:hypothetical protein
MQPQISRSHSRRSSEENMEFLGAQRGRCGVLDVSHPGQSMLFAVAAVAGSVGGPGDGGMEGCFGKCRFVQRQS